MPRPRKTSYGDDKPPYSYVALCTMAINSSPSKMMTLSAIYKYIMEKFPFYRKSSSRWQNSLRHNLSYNDCFVKISKGNDQSGSSGKGSYWTLHQSSSQMFQEGSYLRRKRRFHDKEENGTGADDDTNSDNSSQSINNRKIDDSPPGQQHQQNKVNHNDEDEYSRSIYTEKDEYLRSSPSHYTRFTIDSILDNNSRKDNNTAITSHHIPTTTLSKEKHRRISSVENNHKLSSGTAGVRFNNNMTNFEGDLTTNSNYFTHQSDETMRDNFKRTTRPSTVDFTEQHTTYNKKSNLYYDSNS